MFKDRVDYQKLCAHWVLKMLTEDQVANKIEWLQHRHFSHITKVKEMIFSTVMVIETWLSHHIPENK